MQYSASVLAYSVSYRALYVRTYVRTGRQEMRGVHSIAPYVRKNCPTRNELRVAVVEVTFIIY